VNTNLSNYAWPEVAELLEHDPIAVVPIGAFEQHGHHLPLKVDWFLCSQVAARAADRAAATGVRVLVTPPVWTGYSPHHLDFPGTVSLDAATLTALIVGIATSLDRHGFRKILFLNGHGGNANILKSTVQQLRFEHDIDVLSASYWDFALEEIGEWRLSEVGGINHACEMETSLMLALAEEEVVLDKAEDLYLERATYLPADLAVGGPVTRAATFSDLSPHGAIGAPTLATKERGEALLETLADKIAGFLNEFGRWPNRKEVP
jgi:creatinine amidohydrolase